MAVPRARRMRSHTVSLGIVSAVALALTSCSSDDSPDLRCVDTQTFKNVSDKLCDSQPGDGYASTDRYQWYQDDDHHSSGSSYHSYGHRYTGSRHSSGSSSHSGVSKGGFGGHGHSSGS